MYNNLLYDDEENNVKKPTQILDEDFKKRLKSHFKKYKWAYLIGGALVCIGIGVKLGRKLDSSSSPSLSSPSRSDLRKFDKILGGWPLPNSNADTSISDIPVVSKWKAPLKAIGIETLADLVKYTRDHNGVWQLTQEPGMGNSTVRSINNYFRSNSSGGFHSLYF